MNSLNKLLISFRDLIYPPLCLHCDELIFSDERLFCTDCVSQLEVIDASMRCPYCFSSDYCAERKICELCRTQQSHLTRIASVFDYIGPPATLIKKLKYGDSPHLAEGAAAFMAAQLLRMDWPLPDLIVPVPISLTHWFVRGYNQSLLLAESLSKILDCPIQECLKRRSGDYSQAGLNYSQRLELKGDTLILKKNHELQDKTILLIDDVLTTGSTLKKCAEALYEGCPQSIYALTVCRSIQ